MTDLMVTKRCCTCKEIKPVSEFSRKRTEKSGYHCQCKSCIKQYKQTEKYRAYDRLYHSNEYRISPEKRRVKHLLYISRHPDKYAARKDVTRAVKSHKLKRVTDCLCVFCNCRAQEYHHYKGYDKHNRLTVIPVCIPCHNLQHPKIQCKK
jgi:hypothetical protein